MATDSPNYDLEGQNESTTNADYNDYIMRWGQVVASTEKDPSGAGRCKVFIRQLDKDLVGDGSKDGLNQEDFLKNSEDYSQIVDALPWSLPLQPKFLVTSPKAGESVLVIIPDRKNDKLERFYIGPFISQPQDLSDDGSINGILSGKRGSFNGLLSLDKAWFKNNGARLGGEFSDSNWSVYTDDPKDPNDIGINGRDNEDIILRSSKKYDEVLLRVNKYDNKNKKMIQTNTSTTHTSFTNTPDSRSPCSGWRAPTPPTIFAIFSPRISFIISTDGIGIKISILADSLIVGRCILTLTVLPK